VSSDQSVCPYCGEKHPGAWYKKILYSAIFNDPVKFAKLIIGINVVIYVLSIFMSGTSTGLSLNPLNFLSPDTRSLIFLGAGGRIPVDRFSFYWSFISASYLHGSVLHIFFNMVAFYQLFGIMNNFYGVARSFIIYFFSGIAGFFLSYKMGTPLTIGASAAICGFIGACFYYGFSRGGMYGKLVLKQVSGWILSLAVFGLLVPGIDNFGHLGGFIGGALTAFLLNYKEQRQENFVDRLIFIILFIFTILVLIWSVLVASGVLKFIPINYWRL